MNTNILTNMATNLKQKKFTCDICDFKCSKLSNFNVHKATAKHIRRIMPNVNLPKNAEPKYTCNCGKKYMQA